MSEYVLAFAAFLGGALLMALLAVCSEGGLSGWLAERHLDWRVRRIVRRRDLDVMHIHLLQEEGCLSGDGRVDPAVEAALAADLAAFDEVWQMLGPPPGWEPDEPWDSSGWLEDAPREGGER